MKATKNAHDWHCQEHEVYGWRGDVCKECTTQQLAERETEVADLKKQLYAALFEPVLMSDWRKLEQERDELREQIKLLRDALIIAYPALNEVFGEYPLNRGLSNAVFAIGNALAATATKEQKP